jgi:hypothetical protein
VKPVMASPRRSTPRPRRPFRDNTRLILAGIAVLIVALAVILALATRSARLAPDFLTEVVLYALSATNLTILVALVFVLARNIVKLLVEKRRGLPFAHFRAKLVAMLLGMTLIPAVLVLLVGSELIRNSIDQWFNAPMDDVLSSANEIAGDYYQERESFVSAQAQRYAQSLGDLDLTSAPAAPVRAVIDPDVTQGRVDLVEVYRVEPAAGAGTPLLIPVVDARSRALPPDYDRRSADALAARAVGGAKLAPVVDRLTDGGDLIRNAVAVPAAATGRTQGVVIVSEFVPKEFAARARRMTQAYEDYQQLRVLKQPLASVYPLVLSHPDAHDSGRRGVDGSVPCQAHYATGPDAGDGGQRDRRRTSRSSRRSGDARRVRIAHRGVQPDGVGPVNQPSPPRALVDRARAEAPGCRGPTPVCRDDSRAHCRGRHLRRHVRSDSHPEFRRRAHARPGCECLRTSGRIGVRKAGAETAGHDAGQCRAQPR